MSKFEDLMARAGVAKDEDFAGWQAARARGVTATNVRDLVTGGSARRKELLAEKRGTPAEFVGNRYTEWGNLREDALAPVLEGAGMSPESRVFHAADNDRYLASPDGVGEDLFGEIVLAEVKTSKHDLTPGGEHYTSYGYYDQMQWQMLVCGAARTLFVWEQHDDRWPNPTPMPHQCAWVERDEERIAYLQTVADAFLDELVGAETLTPGERRQFQARGKKIAEGKEAEAWVREHARGRQFDLTMEHRGRKLVFSSSGDKTKRVSEPDVEAAKSAAPDVWAALEEAQAAWDAVLADHQVSVSKPVKGRLSARFEKAAA